MDDRIPAKQPSIERPEWVVGGDRHTWFALGSDIVVPQVVEVRYIADDEWDYFVDATVVFDQRSMRYEITSVTVNSYIIEGRPTPVTAKALRSVLINRLEEKIFTAAFPLIVANEKLSSIEGFGIDGMRRSAELVRGNGPSPEALEVAANIYTLFFAFRSKPTQRIAELMALPPSTASHWVRLARQRGYLSKDSTKSIDRAQVVQVDGIEDESEAG